MVSSLPPSAPSFATVVVIPLVATFYSLTFLEGASVLKKSPSDQSIVQDNAKILKTSPKHYKIGVLRL